jgi:hypothetical protein
VHRRGLAGPPAVRATQGRSARRMTEARYFARTSWRLNHLSSVLQIRPWGRHGLAVITPGGKGSLSEKSSNSNGSGEGSG